MKMTLILFSIMSCFFFAAGQARAFSSNPADYGAAFINGKIVIFGRLAKDQTWSGLTPTEQMQTFGYRCYDSTNSVWKTAGSRAVRGLRVMLLADMKCVKEDGYCADPNKAPDKAARGTYPTYAVCRQAPQNASGFICELDAKDVAALCELNSLPPERKFEELFDETRYDIRLIFVDGKGGAFRSPALTYEDLFGASHADSDADGIPDAWDDESAAQ